jgi:hypothetical protein
MKAFLFCVLLLGGAAAWAAQVAGTVVQLSGPLVAKKADGRIKVLGLKSEVEQGDTLVSEKNTFALIRFIDNSEITLRPATTFTIENFSFDADKPEGDNAAFSLVKGGLRSVTGALGHRNKSKFAMKTPTATIGIRGTTFIAQYVPPPPIVTNTSSLGAQLGLSQLDKPAGKVPGDAGDMRLPPPGTGGPATKVPAGPPLAPPPGPVGPPVLAPGLHLTVTDGAIIVTNNGGSLGFQAGQFGYVPNVNQAPVIVPPNPGLHFVPPPSFNISTGPTASTNPSAAKQIDCIVR